MRIRWTQTAAHDLTSICDYIQQHDTPSTARRIALLIYQSAGSLNKFPHRGRVGRKPGTRELVLTNLPYVVIYRVRENIVEIIRILHGAQNWP